MFEIGSLKEERVIEVFEVPIEVCNRYVPPPVGLKVPNCGVGCVCGAIVKKAAKERKTAEAIVKRVFNMV